MDWSDFCSFNICILFGTAALISTVRIYHPSTLSLFSSLIQELWHIFTEDFEKNTWFCPWTVRVMLELPLTVGKYWTVLILVWYCTIFKYISEVLITKTNDTIQIVGWNYHPWDQMVRWIWELSKVVYQLLVYQTE